MDEDEPQDWYDECAEIIYNAILDYHRLGYQQEVELGGASAAWIAAYGTMEQVADLIAPDKPRECDVIGPI